MAKIDKRPVEEDKEQPGVESEGADPRLQVKDPFDPEKIKVRTEYRVIEHIVGRIGHNGIDLAPDFQRLRGVWDHGRRSRLIESLLLRIPLAVFYVAADDKDNWAIVDGFQRLSAMSDFANGTFALSGLEYLTMFEGARFLDLPRAMQRRLNETQLQIHVIDADTPMDVMFNIFKRINTGGLRLNDQEIRHALHKGPVRDFLKELAGTTAFRKATGGTVKKDRMADRECVLRFLAFRIDPWERYSANGLDGYFGQTMSKLNAMPGAERARLKIDFKKAMKAAHAIFDGDAFRKLDAEGKVRYPVSKALFEAWSVELAKCTQPELDTLIAKKDRVRETFMNLLQNREFNKAISLATGAPERVAKRFQGVRNVIKGCLS